MSAKGELELLGKKKQVFFCGRAEMGWYRVTLQAGKEQQVLEFKPHHCGTSKDKAGGRKGRDGSRV